MRLLNVRRRSKFLAATKFRAVNFIFKVLIKHQDQEILNSCRRSSLMKADKTRGKYLCSLDIESRFSLAKATRHHQGSYLFLIVLTRIQSQYHCSERFVKIGLNDAGFTHNSSAENPVSRPFKQSHSTTPGFMSEAQTACGPVEALLYLAFTCLDQHLWKGLICD